MLSERLAEKLPGTLILKIQLITTLVLLFAMVIACFGGFAVMDTGVDSEVNEELLIELQERGVQVDIIPDSVSVGITYILDAATGIPGYIHLLDGDTDTASMSTLKTLAFVMAMKHGFAENAVIGLCNVVLILISLVLPFVLLIKAFAALISFLRRISDPQEAFVKLSSAYNKRFTSFAVVFALSAIIPGVKIGSGLIAAIVISVLGYLVHIAASRLKYYEMSDFIYLSVWQGSGLLGAIGFAVFMAAITSSGIVSDMIASLGEYANVGAASDVEFIPVFLTILAAVLVINSCEYLAQSLRRLACTGGKYSSLGSMIRTSIYLTAFIAIPLVVSGSNMPFAISGENTAGFILSIVGALLMVLAEVAYFVLCRILCPECSDEDVEEIVNGSYTAE